MSPSPALPAPTATPVARLLASQIPSSGLPLGGIGSGGIELWADGVFRAPNFTNPGPWSHGFSHFAPAGVSAAPPYSVEDQFFLLRVKTPSRGIQLRFLFVGHGTAFNSWGHMPRTYKYARIPAMKAIDHEEAFPFTRLRYVDDSLPVEVALEAWTPFVPHDLDASSLPGAYFDFTVTNRGSEPAEISLLHTATNLAGWDQDDFQQHHTPLDLPASARGVLMRGGRGDHPTTGDLTVFAHAPGTPSARIALAEAHPWLENIIWPFNQSGAVDGPLHLARLTRVEYFPLNAAGQLAKSRWTMAPGLHRNRAWTSIHLPLAPGASSHLGFGLAWHFPHHRDRYGAFVGKAYAARFTDSAAVAAHLLENRERYHARSLVWPSLVNGSTLPTAFASGLLDQLGTLVKGTWLAHDGDFFIWEGLGHAALNTVDVEHYGSFALALLFPSVRARVLRQAIDAQRPDGHISHGYQKRREDIINGEYARWDVNAQFVLAAYREWRWTGDTALLAECYPAATRAMRHLITQDRHGLGLPWTEGGITYDHWHLKGVVTYLAVLHLAALQALVRMATALGATADAAEFAAAWTRGRAAAETLLWDEAAGRYRIVNRGNIAPPPATPSASAAAHAEPDLYATFYGVHGDTPRMPVDDGLHTDALNGDVFARLTGLPVALDPARRRAMTRLIVAQNRHADGRFLANGTCPDDAFPDEWPLAQWHNPWTGIEYFFAAQLFQEGLIDEGLAIIRDVHERMSEAGVRFNHPECGDHYSRALSIYAALLAYNGVEYIAPERRLALLPVAPAAGRRLPVITTTACGELTFAPDHWLLRIATGTLALDRLTLPAAQRLLTLTRNGVDMPFTPTVAQDLTLAKPVVLQAGDRLRLNFAPATPA